jgi:pimeloyl-ACP methyl ester carboxylesterase
VTARRVAVSVSVAAAAVGLVAGVGWGLAHVANRRLRARAPDDDGPGAPRDALDPPSDRVHTIATADGGTLRVLERGSGPPVVLVHGYTLTSAVWTLQLERWPEHGHRVVAYDQRGHGGSLAGADGITAASLAADLRTVLEELDLRDVVLVGHSLGGMVVQALAVEHADVVATRVARVVLLSTAARGVSWVDSPLRSFVERAGALYGRIGPLAMGRRELGFLLASVGVGPDAPVWVIERAQAMTQACPPETLVAAGRVLLRFDVSTRVEAVAAPTLVVCGTHDRLTPPRESVRLVERIPGAVLEVLPRVGHLVMLEAPDRLEALALAPTGADGGGAAERRGDEALAVSVAASGSGEARP